MHEVGELVGGWTPASVAMRMGVLHRDSFEVLMVRRSSTFIYGRGMSTPPGILTLSVWYAHPQVWYPHNRAW